MVSVVVTGPESTGKSTLTQQLAEHFNATVQSEYARDYVERLKREYNFHDVETIARRQCFLFEKQLLVSDVNQLTFFDTFLIVTKVWFQEVYKKCPIWLHAAIVKYKPSLTLLCVPDIEWQYDKVRENQFNRDYLFQCYLTELEYYKIDYRLVEGFGEKRLSTAIKQVNNWLSLNLKT